MLRRPLLWLLVAAPLAALWVPPPAWQAPPRTVEARATAVGAARRALETLGALDAELREVPALSRDGQWQQAVVDQLQQLLVTLPDLDGDAPLSGLRPDLFQYAAGILEGSRRSTLPRALRCRPGLCHRVASRRHWRPPAGSTSPTRSATGCGGWTRGGTSFWEASRSPARRSGLPCGRRGALTAVASGRSA